jgi:hypothetical protein
MLAGVEESVHIKEGLGDIGLLNQHAQGCTNCNQGRTRTMEGHRLIRMQARQGTSRQHIQKTKQRQYTFRAT